MSTDATLTFYHAPNTRSTGVRILLDELGADYRLVALDAKAGRAPQAGVPGGEPDGQGAGDRA